MTLEDYQALKAEGKMAARLASLDNVARATGMHFVGTVEAHSDDKTPQSGSVKQTVMRGKVKSASAAGVLTIAVEKLFVANRPTSRGILHKFGSRAARYRKFKVGERVIVEADTVEADVNQDVDIPSKHG